MILLNRDRASEGRGPKGALAMLQRSGAAIEQSESRNRSVLAAFSVCAGSAPAAILFEAVLPVLSAAVCAALVRPGP